MTLTTKKKSEQKSIKSDAKKTDNNVYLIEREQVEGTPLTIIKQVDEQNQTNWYITLGSFRLNEEPYKSEKDALEAIKRKDWGLIMGIAWIVAKSAIESKNL